MYSVQFYSRLILTNRCASLSNSATIVTINTGAKSIFVAMYSQDVQPREETKCKAYNRPLSSINYLCFLFLHKHYYNVVQLENNSGHQRQTDLSPC